MPWQLLAGLRPKRTNLFGSTQQISATGAQLIKRTIETLLCRPEFRIEFLHVFDKACKLVIKISCLTDDFLDVLILLFLAPDVADRPHRCQQGRGAHHYNVPAEGFVKKGRVELNRKCERTFDRNKEEHEIKAV